MNRSTHDLDPVALLSKLISVPSESSAAVAPAPGDNPEQKVLLHLEQFFAAHGVNVRREPVDEGTRRNLVARLPAAGKPRVCIAGHMDTVSAQGMAKPFTPTLQDGRMHGRGSCDDKGPLAAAVTALCACARENTAAFDVTFLATCGEEAGMPGARSHVATGKEYDLILVLEPTALRIINAHKGMCRLTLTTRGTACHSSMPERGRNAIYAMMPLIARLRAFSRGLAETVDPLLGSPTLTVTCINGGTSVNTVPDKCTAQVDVRLLPGADLDDVITQIREAVGDDGEVGVLTRASGMRSGPRGRAWDIFCETLTAAGVDTAPGAVHYATDAAYLSALGPCIVWGPGDIAQAHSANEFIAVDELTRATDILQDWLTA